MILFNYIYKRLKKGRTIIYMLLPMFFLNVELNAQNLTIKGKVIDTDGNALPDVAVVVQGATTGVVTNDEGDYTLPNIAIGAILEFKLVGYVTQEIRVAADKTSVNVILLEETVSLDETVVVAFSRQKKESVMASITTVKPSELKIPSSNLTTALAGRIAGLISYQRTGEPGADNAEFFIRGVTSFGSGRIEPLILIDGVEMTADDLARLTTDDIASFSVMKDANATALYGARGANGVVLVTTKEGGEGKMRVQLRLESSLSTPTEMIDIADPITFMKLNNEATRTRNPLSMLPYTSQEIWNRERGINPVMYPMVDWQDILFNDQTINHRYNLNVSGGGAIARYYIAASYSRDNGIINMDERNNFNNNIEIDKYVLRSNVNINLTKTTEVIARLHAAFDDYSGPLDDGAELFTKARNANPVRFLPYYEPDEANILTKHILFGNAYSSEGTGLYMNPYAEMVKGYRTSSRSSMSAQFELKQDFSFITEGLSARALLNFNRYSLLEAKRSYKPFFYQAYSWDFLPYYLFPLNPETGQDYLTQEGGKSEINQTMYFESAVQYNRVFNNKHSVSGLLVYTLRDYLNTKNALGADLLNSLAQRNLGLAGRATYGYDSRYFFEFNFGYNGSERFAKKERFGFFPSAGIGWIVSNEAFMKPLEKVISKLKLKATYGSVGNDDIGGTRFYYLSKVDMNVANKSYSFGDGGSYSTVGISNYGDAGITWQISYKSNFGIELNLWKNLEIQMDYSTEKRVNILQERTLPSTMGLQTGMNANIGEASSKAFEASVDYSKSFNKDFWTIVRANFTYARGIYDVFEEPAYQNGPRRSHIGQSITQQYGYIADRLFLDEEEVKNSPSQVALGEYAAGDIKYKDINGDLKIDRDDMVPIGYPTRPEINYGFGFSLGYQNFDFSCFFQGSARSSFWIDAKATSPFINDVKGGVGSRALLQYYADDHWSETNKNIYALWPRLSPRVVENNGWGDGTRKDDEPEQRLNTWFMRDGSFLRLKTVEIGYSLPKKWINPIRMQNIRFYVSGVNLLSFSKFKMWDVEMAGDGLAYPVQRVFNLGLNIEF